MRVNNFIKPLKAFTTLQPRMSFIYFSEVHNQ